MRLIDADTLMSEFAEFVKSSNNSDFAKVPTWNDAVSLVGSQPTAYDVDKVVKQLKSEKYKIPIDEYEEGVNSMCNLAIKIVKAGGINAAD